MMRKLLYSFLFFIFLHSVGLGQTSTTVTLNAGTGSFTVPCGVTSITVECWGAGGAGGGTTSNNAQGGGGGAGGAYARSTFLVSPNQVFNCSIAGTTNGATSAGALGGDTWFSSPTILLAKGGAGGAAPAGTGVSGGTGTATASIGDSVSPGLSGNAGNSSQGGAGGNAGGTGGGTGGNLRNNSGNGGDGNSGNPPGGGGGGAYVGNNSNRAGGSGGAGQIRITYTISSTIVPTSQVGGSYTFCTDGTSSYTTGNASGGQYALVNVIRGYKYTFSVGNAFASLDENLTILDASTDANVSPAASATGSNSATITNWFSSLSGQVKVVLSAVGCGGNGTNGTSGITVTQTAIGNNLDDQTAAGTNVWKGHLYNWTSASLPPGGTSPLTPPTTTPFTNAEYAGYYDFGSETIGSAYNFGGDDVCFNVFSNGVQRASIRTETFAVRYRMKSTRPEGCYLVTLRGDDGVRLYVDDVRVFDEWKEQSSTEYANVLVYLKGPAAGGSDLIFDYYENGGQNQVSFSMVPFDVNSNSIVAPTPSLVCSGTRPNTIDGSSYLYNNSSVNPTIKYQWQTATSANGPWTDINGATLEDYRPTAISPTPSSVVNYYRRIVSAAASNASACSWISNVISITTGVAGTPGAPAANAASSVTCSSFTANWNSVASASGYRIDVARNNNFSAANMVYSDLDAGLVTSFNISGLDPAVTTYYYRVKAYGCNGTSAGNSGIITVAMTLPTVVISGTTTVCQNANSPSVTFTNSQNSAITVTYNINGGTNATVNVPANAATNVPVPTTAIGTFTYNLVSAVYQAVPACTRNLSGSATVTVGIGNNIITYNNGNSNSVCVAVDENQTAIFIAPAGTYFNTVSFASYGSPTGSCGAFQINYVCHSAVKSQSYTESSLLGNTGTINVVANNENFDDPCVSTFKAYKAVARYSEPICAGTIPGQISGSAPTGGGAYAYLWEISTTSSTSGFSAAPGTNNTQNYIPTVQVTRDTWFRRTVTSGGTCPNVSAVVLIKVNPSPTLAGASQSVSVCSGSAATINLTGLLAGSTSTISYSINSVAQTPITSVVANSGGTASFTTPVLTEVDNGHILQITGVTTTSTTPNCSLSFSTNVTLAVNPTPTLVGASQPLSVCTGSAATINLTGLLAGSTSTISYSINSVAQTPITSVIATAGGTASFTTPALTYANNGQTLRITQITTTSSTPNCSSSFTSDVILSVNATPTTPTITKNNDAACNTLGSITITGLSGNWTVNQTGATTLPKSYPGPGASLAIQDLAADTYSFTVANNDTGCTSSAVTVTITDTSSNTDWGPSGWTNGEPDGSKSVTISSLANGQPFSLAKPNITACSLTITVGSDVIIPSGVTLEITNKVTSNGRLVFESGSSLIQTTNVQNSGDIVYKRATSIRRFDLTYWSSPITSTKQDGFMMKDLSPETLFDKYSYWSSSFKWATDLYGNMEMKPGIGYSIRGPQSFSIETPAEFIGKFSGIPNNGDIPISTTADKYVLIGNPYPSAIDGRKFITDNGDVGALYFWTHVSLPKKAEGSNTYRYSSPDYAVFTLLGATRATTGGETPSGYIGVGQGFFIKPKVTSIKFNNGQRVKAENSQFFKTSAKEAAIEVNRLWLNLSNTDDAYKQILIGYAEGATNSFDYNYDAVTLAGNTYVDFYTINEAQKLSIQARSLPFDNTERIPLGYKSVAETQLTISIDHADGFFNKQAVYLEDKTTGTITDLRASNYTFKTGIGTFTDRFVLRYTNKTLGTDDIENLENSVLISVKNKTVSITCSKETIKDITIFNVSGQLVYSKNKVNSSELQITNLHSSDQVLLVKVTLENGSVITKKVIFSNL